MSNLLFGKIVCTDDFQFYSSNIKAEIIDYSIDNNFWVDFIDALEYNEEAIGDISFRVSDNASVQYCEEFLEPIIYNREGEPILSGIRKDIEVLRGLIKKIFNFEFVKALELRLSFVEVNEEDYDVVTTSFEDFPKSLLRCFLSCTNFPVVKIVLSR